MNKHIYKQTDYTYVQSNYGASSAASFGAADTLASQSSERMGAPRTLAGMLSDSTLMLTVTLLFRGEFTLLFAVESFTGWGFGILHGILIAVASLFISCDGHRQDHSSYSNCWSSPSFYCCFF